MGKSRPSLLASLLKGCPQSLSSFLCWSWHPTVLGRPSPHTRTRPATLPKHTHSLAAATGSGWVWARLKATWSGPTLGVC